MKHASDSVPEPGSAHLFTASLVVRWLFSNLDSAFFPNIFYRIIFVLLIEKFGPPRIYATIVKAYLLIDCLLLLLLFFSID